MQDEHKSQHRLATERREISLTNVQVGYQLMTNGSGVQNGMLIIASIKKCQSQPTQPSIASRSVPSLPPPPLPSSPRLSPNHAPQPPPPPISPPKLPTSTSFSSSIEGAHSLPTSMRSFPDLKPSTHGFQYQHSPLHHGPVFSSMGSHVMHHMSPFK